MRKLSLALRFIVAAWLGCADTRSAETSAPPVGAAVESADKKISLAPAAASSLAYPPSPAQDVSEQIFGQTVRDPYRWLEDANSPKVQAWMKAQDELARAELAKLPGRDALAARLRELLYVETVTPPIHRGNRFFYTRRRADQEKAIVYFRE